MFADSKPHYVLLDALRGVCALCVVYYHIFEGFATSPQEEQFNHGYLAVDFFFILSGFVIGYAYDDRWPQMGLRAFFRRRLIRLHPMVVMGTLIGLATYLIQGAETWDGAHPNPLQIVLAAVMGMLMLPCWPGCRADVRGNGEMFSLDGPQWSLFFEYIGNILYALIIHRLPTRVLRIWTLLLGIGLIAMALSDVSGSYSIGVGWTMAESGLPGGLLRMLFSYSLGMLLARNQRLHHLTLPLPAIIAAAFVLIGCFSVPYIGGQSHPECNAIYDCLCLMVVFPIVLLTGANIKSIGDRMTRVSHFLGHLSYPLYMVHYPLMYLFFSYIWEHQLSFSQAWPIALLTYLGSLLLGWLVYRLYDAPVRKWLTNRLVRR